MRHRQQRQSPSFRSQSLSPFLHFFQVLVSPHWTIATGAVRRDDLRPLQISRFSVFPIWVEFWGLHSSGAGSQTAGGSRTF